MFARQIAVMKGQAWNVVETLKQADHGPLELTRRTRVCVWDDLVDVPVAIPLRVPSSEVSRTRKTRHIDEEEMDIGAAHSSAPAPRQFQPQYDLLGSPTSELPNPNRFDLTRDDNNGDLSNIGEEPTSPITLSGSHPNADSDAREAKNNLSHSMSLPPRPSARGKTRFSFEFPRKEPRGGVRRQRSMSTRSGSKQPPMIYEGDDLEGDLGYAAASELERHQRKVIVERLEAVKSKNPVFTWC